MICYNDDANLIKKTHINVHARTIFSPPHQIHGAIDLCKPSFRPAQQKKPIQHLATLEITIFLYTHISFTKFQHHQNLPIFLFIPLLLPNTHFHHQSHKKQRNLPSSTPSFRHFRTPLYYFFLHLHHVFLPAKSAKHAPQASQQRFTPSLPHLTLHPIPYLIFSAFHPSPPSPPSHPPLFQSLKR